MRSVASGPRAALLSLLLACALLLCGAEGSLAAPSRCPEAPQCNCDAPGKRADATPLSPESLHALRREGAALLAGRDGAIVMLQVREGLPILCVNERTAYGRAFPPGSIFKLVTAYALLKRKEFNPDRVVTCRDRFRQDGRLFTCEARGGHGAADLRRALAVSCCVYFYTEGQALSREELSAAAEFLGLGRSGALAGEVSGTLKMPSSRTAFTEMLVGEGGAVKTTPLQAARLSRALALLPEGRASKLLNEGMRCAVLYGTAKRAAVKGVPVAGKTGTAQDGNAPGKTHCWFVGYAPAGAPEVAIAVFLARGKGATDAAPLAGKLLKRYFDLKRKSRVQMSVSATTSSAGTRQLQRRDRASLSARAGAKRGRKGAVRVRLYSLKTKTSLEVRSAGALRITGASAPVGSARLAPRGANVQVTAPGGAYTVPEARLEGNSFILEPGSSERRLGGTLLVRSTGTRLVVVLTLSPEEYAAGVALAEMPPGAPLEAMKAQAICARTWAAAMAGRHGREGYDFCDSTHCQHFRSFAAIGSDARGAAAATRELHLTVRGRPLEAFYHSTCGGHTAESREVFPGAIEGITAVSDPWCAISPHSRWSATVPVAALQRALRLPSGFRLQSIIATSRGSSGRVRELEVVGREKRFTLPGYDFWLRTGNALGWGKIRSTLFAVAVGRDGVHFTGRGLGHGLGLCQWGACGMARRGCTFREILRRYYPSAALTIL